MAFKVGAVREIPACDVPDLVRWICVNCCCRDQRRAGCEAKAEGERRVMGGAPVLQVLTRCFGDHRCWCAIWLRWRRWGAGVEHTLLVDTLGRGVGASYEALATVPVRGAVHLDSG